MIVYEHGDDGACVFVVFVLCIVYIHANTGGLYFSLPLALLQPFNIITCTTSLSHTYTHTYTHAHIHTHTLSFHFHTEYPAHPTRTQTTIGAATAACIYTTTITT